jgi:retinol dehydrogenase-12
MNSYLSYIIAIIILAIIRRWFNSPKTPLKPNVKDKIIIVTGASEGIGKTTALELLKSGAHVILACRDANKTHKIISSIWDLDQRNRIHYINLNLADFSSIKKFISDFSKKFDKLDILINNAGAVNKDYKLTRDNIEATLQVNTIGPMILTQGLLKYFSPEGRVINVASRSYQNWRKDENYYKEISPLSYDFERANYGPYSQYCYSKIGNIYFNQALEEYIKGNGLNIKTVSLHPGTIISEMTRDCTGLVYGFIKLIIYPVMWFITKSPLMGAQTTLHLCYMPFDELISGEYYRDCKVGRLNNRAKNRNMMTDFMMLYKEIVAIYGKEEEFSLSII